MSASFNPPNPSNSQQSDRPENPPGSHPPRNTDAVLGGNVPPPIDAAVLGGSEGIQKRWASDNLDEKILALKQALKADKAALESLCKNSKNEFLLVQLVASYALQHNKGDRTFEQLLQDYPLWQPVRTFTIAIPKTDAYSSAGLSLWESALSPDQRFIFYEVWKEDDNPHLPDHKRPVYDEYAYVLDLKSGNRENFWGFSWPPFPNLECRTWEPSRINDKGYLAYRWFDWNDRKEYSLKLSVPTTQKPFKSGKSILSPDGQLLFIAIEEKICIIDLKSRKLKHTLTGNSEPVENLALTPDGRTLATCDRHGNFFIWDLQTLVLRHSFIGNSGFGTMLALSPDGRILASSCSPQICIWDIESGTLKHNLTSPDYSLTSLAISPDGQILATRCTKFLFWHIPSGELLDTGPWGLLSHDFQLLLSLAQDRLKDSTGIDVWEAAEFFAAHQSQPTEAPNDTQIFVADPPSQPIEAPNDTQIAEAISTTYSNALIYAQYIISEPKRDSRWVNSLDTDLDEQLLGCKIVAYKIQWFSGTWTNWYVPGINDLYQKTNLGESVRRVWSHFNDHRHQYLSIPIDDKNSLRSFSEFDRGLIPQLAGPSGVKYFEGEPTNNTRWANTLSLDIDREITGHQIIAYQIQLANKDWSRWLIPGYQDIYQVYHDSEKSLHRWWAYFSHSSYRYLYME